MKYAYLLIGICLLSFQLHAQTALEQADRELESLSYVKAANLYEKVLMEKDLDTPRLLSVQHKLAFTYRQLRDFLNVEKVLREMIIRYGNDLPDEYRRNYLYFAQALASNGKYNEAQEAYDKYNNLRDGGAYKSGYSKLYSNVALLSRNVGSYAIERLNINSSDADFSPVYYKEGLVFVSNRNEPLRLKRVFNWNSTNFLDLYYLPNLEKIKSRPTSSLGGSIESKSNKNHRWSSLLGLDAYTPLTANDSPTVGFFAGSAYNSSLGYDERPLTESERFNKTINSKYHEGPATFFKGEEKVIFTRNNFNNNEYRASTEGINKLKLYSAELVRGTWGNIQELSMNSDEYSTGHPALHPDNTYLYYASDRPGGLGGTDIYVSKYEDGVWGEPVNLGPEVNTSGNELFPFVDANGNLYFSSDGHFGMGNLDIYFAPMSTPVRAGKSINLGAPINSSKDDFGIITDAERSQGFFSSNRKGDTNDDDIYRFVRQGPLYACRDLTLQVYDAKSRALLPGTLIQIQNKKGGQDLRQLQTDSSGNVILCLEAENEFIFTASRAGYVNTTVGFRTEAYADDRPTMLEISLTASQGVVSSSIKELAKGKVLDQKNNKPLSGAEVTIEDETSREIQKVTSEADGSYTFEAVPGHNYTLDARLQKYATFGKKVVAYSARSPLNLTIHMFGRGDAVLIENIYFDLDKAGIRPDASYELDKIVGILEKYPDMKIELGSHTDSRASARYNKLLSEKRALATRAYLIANGISPNRIASKGYGESQLVNACRNGVDCTEEQHQQNRRTEIRILNLQ